MSMAMSCAITKVLRLFPRSRVLSGSECFRLPTVERVLAKKNARRRSSRRTEAVAGAPKPPALLTGKTSFENHKRTSGGSLSGATL